MKKGLLFAASAAFALTLASAASAAQYLVTKGYEGTFLSGTDATGYFGLNDLAGAAYQAQFTWKITDPSATLVMDPSAFVSASITVNGVTHDFLAPNSGATYVDGDETLDAIFTDRVVGSIHYFESFTQKFGFATMPGNLGGAYDTGTGAHPNPLPFLSLGAWDTNTNVTLIDFNGTMINDQVFSTGALRAAIPEPGTWALMISGFGLAGAMLRRRQLAIA